MIDRRPIIDRSANPPNGKSKGLVGLLMTIVLAVVITSAMLLQILRSTEMTTDSDVPVGVAYIVHNPIYIDGNAGFLEDNSSTGISWGSGTADDPYVIEGWDISATSASGIEIRYADVYFTIRNCHIHDGGASYYGVYLWNCRNATLESNICECNWFGILLGFSGYCSILKNDCLDNSASGISLGFSGNSLLDSNTCANNDVGIRLGNSGNNTLRNNTCSFNSQAGLCIETPMPQWIPSPPWPTTSRENTALDNLLYCNLQYGMSIGQYSSANCAWNNSFVGNNGASSVYDSGHVQANDSGTDNWWNSTDCHGSYWSDWTSPDVDEDGVVDDPYDIDGGAGAKDYYPMTATPTVIPEFDSSITVVGVVVVMVTILFISQRRREKRP